MLLLMLEVVEALKLVRMKRANNPSQRSRAIGSAAWALTEWIPVMVSTKND